jgi:hypothetical protein
MYPAHTDVLVDTTERMASMSVYSNRRMVSRMIPRVISLLVVALFGILATACDSSSIQTSTTATPSRTSIVASATPSALPPLMAEKGWHVVITLGNMFGNTQNFAGNFVATRPYKLFFTCKGSGTLHIVYPQAKETSPCTGTPEINGTQEFPPPSGNGQVTVSVSTEGEVMWEVIVEMKN